MNHPHQSPHPSEDKGLRASAHKNDAMIMAVWKHGECDTVDLALRFHLSEAEIYNILGARFQRTPKPKAIKVKKPKGKLRARYASKPAPSTMYRLRSGPSYLHECGEVVTNDKRRAWKGDAAQALACVQRFPIAASMSMEMVL